MWGQFGVDQTSSTPGKRPEMFQKQLQLKDHYKKMVQALVDEHDGRGEVELERTQVKDIVKDKGKGLVILLHGQSNDGPISLIRFSNFQRSSRSWENSKSFDTPLSESDNPSNIRTSAYSRDHRTSYWQASLHCQCC